jgi:hypothetical protein
MRGLGADSGDFVPAVTLDDDRNVANGNADDAWEDYEVSAEELPPAARDVIDVAHPALHLRHERLKAHLAFDEREVANIAAIHLQHLESTKERPLSAEQQLVEVGSPVYIEAGDFPIETAESERMACASSTSR